jgi:hypothetical protein
MRAELWACIVVVAGCGGGDPATSDAAVDAPVSVDAAIDASTECTALEQTAPLVAQIAVADDPPTPLGGAFPDGRYHMVEDTLYTGPNGATGANGQMHRTTTSCTNRVCSVRGYSANLGDLRAVVIFEPDGVNVVARRTCPGTEVSTSMSYTTVVDSTGTRITLYEPRLLGGIAGSVYELQP